MIKINEEKRRRLQETIGYTFFDGSLLEQALSHSSFTNEHRSLNLPDNERLEYLGDAVLELSSSDFLYHNYPDMSEGEMSKMRASLVCEPALALCARQIGLPECIFLGKGEENTGGRGRDSVVSDAMEALIGAIYLDSGFEEAKSFVFRFVMNDIENRSLFHDSKTMLQEITQKDYPDKELEYELVREEGPDHAKVFEVRLWLKDHKSDLDDTKSIKPGRPGRKMLGEGKGSTKKGAEQDAAYHAILSLKDQGHD